MNKLKLMTHVSQIEVGDIVRLMDRKEVLAEGEIEFIDFTIPFGYVLLTIGGEQYDTNRMFAPDIDVYMVQMGPRTADQAAMKRNRLIQVQRQKQRLDGGSSEF